MKKITITKFVCEYCRKKYNIPGDALKCEANHLGVTYQEHLDNTKLSEDEFTEKLFDEAVTAVSKFLIVTNKEQHIKLLKGVIRAVIKVRKRRSKK